MLNFSSGAVEINVGLVLTYINLVKTFMEPTEKTIKFNRCYNSFAFAQMVSLLRYKL